ncbi:hypothetical protein BDD12DRAFT_813675 [Trichophaea hybrida]|nr:hypothetical protein BDD12DRAFT_813675 [Trichophaea hybrida]
MGALLTPLYFFLIVSVLLNNQASSHIRWTKGVILHDTKVREVICLKAAINTLHLLCYQLPPACIAIQSHHKRTLKRIFQSTREP